MKTPTLARDFEALRKSKSLTLLQIANLCDLNETTVHKVSSGKSVRWETLHIILAVGMKVYPGTPDYESMHRLWLKQREDIAAGNTKDKGSKKSPEHEDAAIRAFRKIIRGRDAATVKLILAAARRNAEKR